MLNDDNFKTLSKIRSDLEILGEILEEIYDAEFMRNVLEGADNEVSNMLVNETYDAVMNAIGILNVIERIEDHD